MPSASVSRHNRRKHRVRYRPTCQEREDLTKEYYQYRQFVDKKVESVKKDFEELKAENKKMIKAIYQAYRCTFPEKMPDCPVIKCFEDSCHCEECLHE